MRQAEIYRKDALAFFIRHFPKWQQLIKDSFLSEDQKQAYEELVIVRLNRL